MPTYDLHQHLWPEQFIAALRARATPPRLLRDELVTTEGRFPVDLAAHEPEARIRALDRDEIDVAVLSLQPSLGIDALSPLEQEHLEELWAQEVGAVVAASTGRFLAFSPSRARVGFAGISIGASALRDEPGARALDAAAEQNGLVFVHPEAGTLQSETHPSWWAWTVGYPARMQEAYFAWLDCGRDRWPSVRVVFAILAGGAPFQLERLAHRGVDVRASLDPNTFFDVATYGRRAIELVIETFGVGQLAYGSDTPVVDPRPTLSAVRGFGDSVAQILQIDTPTALLP